MSSYVSSYEQQLPMAVDREFMYIGSAGPGQGGWTDGRRADKRTGGRADGRGGRAEGVF